MLRKKEYTAILETAKSKDEIVALFNSLYSPVPAIRIVREIYHRNADREYEFSCDKCGHGFVVKAENDPEYNEELCVCPNCGHSINLKTNSYYSPKKLYALDEAYRGYQKVLASSGETVDPSFSVFETVEVEAVFYCPQISLQAQARTNQQDEDLSLSHYSREERGQLCRTL